jgi:pimeloyl-ACP methyl ester carboxylesterase
MTKSTRRNTDDLRGASRLVIEATQSIAALVEAMHVTIAGGPELLGRPLEGPARLVTGLVYRGIRGVTKLVGSGLDLALARLAPLLGESAPGPERMALLAALNGVLGDYLCESENPLAMQMRLCRDGQVLEVEKEALRAALPRAAGKLLVLAHGSCMHDGQWRRQGHDHGAALERDLGYTPVYLRYNSGLHISTNGRLLAELLERLVLEWPAPLDELVILGHSMGGLVARGACHVGELEKHAWRRKLRALVCIGSPHHGAPLERGGSWIDLLLGSTRYTAPLARLGQIRSAGVTDMRHGSVLDEHWESTDRFAHVGELRTSLELPRDVACYAIAATTTPEGGGTLRGDGLVPVESALGRHAKPELTLGFPEAHLWIAHGTGHLELLNRGEVYVTIRSWLSSPPAPSRYSSS